MIRERYGFWLLVACLALGGCQALSTAQSDEGDALPPPSGPGLVAKSRSPIPDVPAPIGFVQLTSRSSNYVSAQGARVVNHVYQGRGRIADTVVFYRRHLVLNGWQAVRERSGAGVTQMVYAKGREELSIEVSRPRVVNIVVRIRDRELAATHTPVKP